MKRKLFSLFIAALCCVSTWALDQDTDGYYLLGSAQDWQEFAALVQTTPAANARMVADIDLGDDQTHIGSMAEGGTPSYAGVFDGQGHTLTVNYVGGSNQIVAPFTKTSGATIKNLHVAGSIQSAFAYIGVVGMAGSGSVISKVWMSATMTTSQSGWVQSAAIAGYCDGTIRDCLFTGTYTSNGSSAGGMGGFYGYTNASPAITNCLSTGTFTQGNWQGGGVHTNCYLKQYPTDLTTGCSWATDEALADGTIATALQAGREEEIWVQDGDSPMLKLFASEIAPEEPTVWENGVLPGKFSINANGDQVFFSQGNLQYQATTDIWRFAICQSDYIGANNTYISETYDDWVDLLQWGAGDNPTTIVTYTYNTFVEFGSHAISNGGNTPDAWRTMTKDEWVYIFCGRTNAESLFGLGAVNGVNGVIILPDNWTTPDDLTFNPSTEHGLTWLSDGYYRSNTADGYSHNVYTSEQWTTMETNGAVFLPSAGVRYFGSRNIGLIGTEGYYWSSTKTGSTHANIMTFSANILNPQHNGMQDYGHSIRLVQAVPSDPGPATGIEEGTGDGLRVTEKILRDNQILILRGEKVYTITGQEVK